MNFTGFHSKEQIGVSMEERKEKRIQQTSESFLNIAAFVVFSFVPYSLFYISMTAAEDILADTLIPTSVVYLCGIAPYLLGTLVLPVFEDKIPHLLTMLLTFGFDLCGIIFLAAFENKEAKLGGICLISLASAFADVGFLSLTALYGEVTVRGYVTGTGIGFAAAVMYYAGRVNRNPILFTKRVLALTHFTLVFLSVFVS